MPFKKRPEDGGFDFYVDLHSTFGKPVEEIPLKPGDVLKLSTGVHCGFPDNTVWTWDIRSSAGLKGIDLCARTIDSQFKGELSVVLVNNSNYNLTIKHGERVAQLVPNPFSKYFYLVEVDSVEKLGRSDRGTNGFGSSGK